MGPCRDKNTIFHPALGVWPEELTSTQVFMGDSVLKLGLEPFSQSCSDSSPQRRQELLLRQGREQIPGWSL